MTATKFKYRLDRRSRRITWGTFAAIAALFVGFHFIWGGAYLPGLVPAAAALYHHAVRAVVPALPHHRRRHAPDPLHRRTDAHPRRGDRDGPAHRPQPFPANDPAAGQLRFRRLLRLLVPPQRLDDLQAVHDRTQAAGADRGHLRRYLHRQLPGSGPAGDALHGGPRPGNGKRFTADALAAGKLSPESILPESTAPGNTRAKAAGTREAPPSQKEPFQEEPSGGKGTPPADGAGLPAKEPTQNTNDKR